MTMSRGSGDTSSRVRRTRRVHDADATDRGGKLVAWAGFVFGSVLSILMNWLHTWLPAKTNPPDWTPGIWPQIGSAVWPVFLLLSVEVLARVRWQSGLLWSLARYGGVGTVAVGSAIISYGHVHAVLESWGYGSVGSSVGPLVLDGLMIACGFALLSEADSADPTARDSHATATDSTDATERDARILELHRRGVTTRDIADEVGVHHSTVARIVARHSGSNTPRNTATGPHPTAASANGQGTQP